MQHAVALSTLELPHTHTHTHTRTRTQRKAPHISTSDLRQLKRAHGFVEIGLVFLLGFPNAQDSRQPRV